MGEANKKYSGDKSLMAEIKKSLKVKEKNIKCEEYAIKKFQENQNKNQWNLDYE